MVVKVFVERGGSTETTLDLDAFQKKRGITDSSAPTATPTTFKNKQNIKKKKPSAPRYEIEDEIQNDGKRNPKRRRVPRESGCTLHSSQIQTASPLASLAPACAAQDVAVVSDVAVVAVAAVIEAVRGRRTTDEICVAL